MTWLPNKNSITAFAPASCANVAVGYDILGFAFDALGDEITLEKRQDDQLAIKSLTGVEDLPIDIEKNIASAVIKKFLHDHQLSIGFNLTIKKGIPLGSGMGGSAASAVAALFALNAFLMPLGIKPMSNEQLIDYALYGEEIATGQRHADNVVPSLLGGITLTRSIDPIDIIQLPTPDLYCIIVHPELRVDTRDARAVLSKTVPLSDMIKQSANLAAFISSLFQNDTALLKRSLKDLIIEPQRASLVKGFYEVKHAAIEAGALGASLSGSGPSIFALSENKAQAAQICSAMTQAFSAQNIASKGWVSSLYSKGARLI